MLLHSILRAPYACRSESPNPHPDAEARVCHNPQRGLLPTPITRLQVAIASNFRHLADLWPDSKDADGTIAAKNASNSSHDLKQLPSSVIEDASAVIGAPGTSVCTPRLEGTCKIRCSQCSLCFACRGSTSCGCWGGTMQQARQSKICGFWNSNIRPRYRTRTACILVGVVYWKAPRCSFQASECTELRYASRLASVCSPGRSGAALWRVFVAEAHVP